MIYEPLQGGWGASQHKDGETGQFCVMDGETYNVPVEIAEMRNGVVIDQFAIHNEDGGAGMFRGGKGQVLDYRVVADDGMTDGPTEAMPERKGARPSGPGCTSCGCTLAPNACTRSVSS